MICEQLCISLLFFLSLWNCHPPPPRSVLTWGEVL
jgi:hypothetical protein